MPRASRRTFVVPDILPPSYSPWATNPNGIQYIPGPQFSPPLESPSSFSPYSGNAPTVLSNNRAPGLEETAALKKTLNMKRNLARFLDENIKEAADASAVLEEPYQELKGLYESSAASYFAAQEYLTSLEQLRDSMRPSIDYITSLLHPIRRYPSDILSLIFIAAVESEQSSDSNLELENQVSSSKYKRRHAALDISHVCRAWRALAHATPEMWRTVRLSLSRRFGAAEKIALWARHAKAIPLNVIIYNLAPNFFPHYASVDSEDEEAVLPLFHSIKRMNSLEVHFSHFRALYCLQRLGTEPLEHLKEFSLRSDPIVLPTAPDFSLTTYLSNARNLRKLTLTNVALILSFHDSNFTLPNVEKLIIHGPMSTDSGFVSLPHYLRMVPNVVKVVYFQNDFMAIPATGMIDMLHLESLSTNFTALSNAFASTFSAGRINAPDLRHFHLITDGQDPSVQLASFLAANPTIRTLHMQGDFNPTSHVSSQVIFTHASRLHTLLLEKTTRGFLQLLHAVDDTGTPAFFPTLSCLEVGCNRMASISMTPEEFNLLFDLRCAPVGRAGLEQFSLETHDGIRKNTREAIERRMKCVHYGEPERYLLFKWNAPKS